MPSIVFKHHNGSKQTVDSPEGNTVMQAAVEEGFDEILAQCGGSCACGTCHVYIDEQWLGSLEPPSPNESSMLEFVTNPKPNSRLSCQIVMRGQLNGLVVQLPESQF